MYHRHLSQTSPPFQHPKNPPRTIEVDSKLFLFFIEYFFQIRSWHTPAGAGTSKSPIWERTSSSIHFLLCSSHSFSSGRPACLFKKTCKHWKFSTRKVRKALIRRICSTQIKFLKSSRSQWEDGPCEAGRRFFEMMFNLES